MFEVRQVPALEPGPGEVRVRVRAAGVCLSDVHLIDGSLTSLFLDGDEVTLGHEVAGEIDALGPDVPAPWQAGQRVVLQAVSTAAGVRTACGCANRAWRCAPAVSTTTAGGPSTRWPATTRWSRSRTSCPSPRRRSCRTPCRRRGARSPASAGRRRRDDRPACGRRLVSAHAVQLRLVGAAPIVAVDPMAPDLRDQVLTLTGGTGLDVAYDMAGAGAVREQALRCLGGRLVLVGLTPEPLAVKDSIGLSFRGQQVIGSHGSGPGAVEQLVELIRFGRLDLRRSISGTVPLADAADAVASLPRRLGLGERVAGRDLLALDQPSDEHSQVAVVMGGVGRRRRRDDVDDEVVDVVGLDVVGLDVEPLLVEPGGPTAAPWRGTAVQCSPRVP